MVGLLSAAGRNLESVIRSTLEGARSAPAGARSHGIPWEPAGHHYHFDWGAPEHSDTASSCGDALGLLWIFI